MRDEGNLPLTMFQSLFYWIEIKNARGGGLYERAIEVSILVLLDRDKEQTATNPSTNRTERFNPCFIG